MTVYTPSLVQAKKKITNPTQKKQNHLSKEPITKPTKKEKTPKWEKNNKLNN
jgi:hypothetical protein